MEMILIADSFGVHSAMIGGAGIVICLFARFVGVTIPVKTMSFFREFEPKTIVILTWGGLRGGIPVALALSLEDYGWDPVIRETILIAVYAVVVFSIIVQGLTMGKLLKS
jgi:CPA1 family monovalent cation:H+ antiporter